ncbi:carbon-nitrogen hydrolase family protein [Slackia piriformis]|nr:carbon-nitrogen hydrolase family protein [Slackia piriformis]
MHRRGRSASSESHRFSELFVPGYPVGMNFGFSIGKRSEEGRKDWKRYYDASVDAGETAFQRLAEAARNTGAYTSVGFSERGAVNGTLYNSNAIFEPGGSYKVHRKLKPTGSERVVWEDADKGYFPVTSTPLGPIGSLICWESYMPLARVALYQKGITIYISPNTNDNPEWQATIRHIAIEGMCFFVNAGMVIRRSSYPSDLHEGDVASRFPEYVCRGGSCIVDPRGHYVTEPVWDEEAVIYTELDMGLPISCKMEHDVAGHYARPDVLELNVNER